MWLISQNEASTCISFLVTEPSTCCPDSVNCLISYLSQNKCPCKPVSLRLFNWLESCLSSPVFLWVCSCYWQRLSLTKLYSQVPLNLFLDQATLDLHRQVLARILVSQSGKNPPFSISDGVPLSLLSSRWYLTTMADLWQESCWVCITCETVSS